MSDNASVEEVWQVLQQLCTCDAYCRTSHFQCVECSMVFHTDRSRLYHHDVYDIAIYCCYYIICCWNPYPSKWSSKRIGKFILYWFHWFYWFYWFHNIFYQRNYFIIRIMRIIHLICTYLFANFLIFRIYWILKDLSYVTYPMKYVHHSVQVREHYYTTMFFLLNQWIISF